MKSIDAIGVSEQDVDRILDKAIQLIGTGEEKYSCCALTVPSDDYQKGKRIRQVYCDVFTDSQAYDFGGEDFRKAIENTTPRNEWVGLRVLLLSLFLAAWRDLV